MQYAFLKQLANDFSAAHVYLESALSINPKSYQIKHAIGRNYCKRALNIENLSAAIHYFEEGERILKELINDSRFIQSKTYSIHCYIYEKLQYSKKFDVKMTRKELDYIDGIIKIARQIDPFDEYIDTVEIKFEILKKHYLYNDAKSNNYIDLNIFPEFISNDN